MKNQYAKTGFPILLLCFLCLPLVKAQAQSSLNRAGLKAGPVLSSFWGKVEDDDLRFRSGYVAGITMSFEIASWFALMPEVLYSSKGAVLYPEGDKRYKINYSLDYLEIPLLFKFVTPSTGLMKGHLYFGPYGAALIQDNVSASYNDVEIRNIDDDYRPDEGWLPLDAGGVIGGGLSFGVADTELSLDLRYTMGLVPIYKSYSYDMVGNRSLAISVGLSL